MFLNHLGWLWQQLVLFVVTLRGVSIGPNIMPLNVIVLEVVCPWVVRNQPSIYVKSDPDSDSPCIATMQGTYLFSPPTVR